MDIISITVKYTVQKCKETDIFWELEQLKYLFPVKL